MEECLQACVLLCLQGSHGHLCCGSQEPEPLTTLLRGPQLRKPRILAFEVEKNSRFLQFQAELEVSKQSWMGAHLPRLPAPPTSSCYPASNAGSTPSLQDPVHLSRHHQVRSRASAPSSVKSVSPQGTPRKVAWDVLRQGRRLQREQRRGSVLCGSSSS